MSLTPCSHYSSIEKIRTGIIPDHFLIQILNSISSSFRLLSTFKITTEMANGGEIIDDKLGGNMRDQTLPVHL